LSYSDSFENFLIKLVPLSEIIQNEYDFNLITHIQFNCLGKSFSNLNIDGCNGKKSNYDELFVGGQKFKIINANITYFF
jgi:hypothetical protein